MVEDGGAGVDASNMQPAAEEKHSMVEGDGCDGRPTRRRYPGHPGSKILPCQDDQSAIIRLRVLYSEAHWVVICRFAGCMVSVQTWMESHFFFSWLRLN